MVTVCRECKERYPACHDYCERYLNAKKELEETKAKMREFQDIENTIAEHKKRLWQKIYKAHRR